MILLKHRKVFVKSDFRVQDTLFFLDSQCLSLVTQNVLADLAKEQYVRTTTSELVYRTLSVTLVTETE